MHVCVLFAFFPEYRYYVCCCGFSPRVDRMKRGGDGGHLFRACAEECFAEEILAMKLFITVVLFFTISLYLLMNEMVCVFTTMARRRLGEGERGVSSMFIYDTVLCAQKYWAGVFLQLLHEALLSRGQGTRDKNAALGVPILEGCLSR